MSHFIIKTLGCKVNQSESENMAASLRKGGLIDAQKEIADTPLNGRVGVCIINTCTVTEKASMQSRQAIRQAIRAYPDARIMVTGCYAETQPDEIRKIEGVTDVLSQECKQTIARNILSRLPDSPETPPSAWPDAASYSGAENSGRRTRAFLKIQDGCNAHCTYCIVPKARGKSRSMPEAQVLSNLEALHRSGYLEVVLSGIHLGCYGLDFSTPSSLLTLLEKLDARGIVPRLRLSSIEPGELSKEIITLVARSDIFCDHFHIPLQSGDDGVLRRMGRMYTRSFFRDLVLQLHDIIPDAAIGLDVLVGFPGETDAAFENTLELVASLPVSYLHVFPFSPRKTTPADTMPDKVNSSVIKNRAARMRRIGESKRLKFHDSLVGRTMDVLVEDAYDGDTGWIRGRTSNYVPVYMENYTGAGNRIVSVTVLKSLEKKGVLAAPISCPAGP